MADDHRLVYEALTDVFDRAEAGVLVTVISTTGSMPRHAGSKMLVRANSSIVGTIGGGAMEALVIEKALEVLQHGQPMTETYQLNSLEAGDPGICGGTATLFFEPLAVPPTLVVIGGGHVGKAVADLGKWAGFRVILSDDRPDYANEDYAPGLDEYVVCAPGQITEHITINANTYIAAVTRGLPVDRNLIPALLGTEAAYIGLIGSRRRWALTVKALQEEHGLTEAELTRVHAPIGLEIEAESPREIAISILAEITMVRRGGTGLPMKWMGTAAQAQGT